MKRISFHLCILALLGASLLWACGPAATPVRRRPLRRARRPNADLILATTTSTQDSGLLDVLVPLFEQETGYKLKVVAVGTGQALQMGQDGNADVLLVHAPSSEKTYMDGGYGKERFLVMHNDFIIVGPAAIRPASRAMPTPWRPSRRLLHPPGSVHLPRRQVRHQHEGTCPVEECRHRCQPETGLVYGVWAGHGRHAHHCLGEGRLHSDRPRHLSGEQSQSAAWISWWRRTTSLLNVYHVITVNPEKWPKINYDGAIAFAKWLTEPSTQEVIGTFGVDKFGQQLFIPDADKTDADLGL